MWYIVTDGVAWSVMVVSPAKCTEPIMMLMGLWTQVGPGKRIRLGTDPPWEGAIFMGWEVAAYSKYREYRLCAAAICYHYY